MSATAARVGSCSGEPSRGNQDRPIRARAGPLARRTGSGLTRQRHLRHALSCSQTMSKPDTDSVRAEGSLTVRDRTRPLTLPAAPSRLRMGYYDDDRPCLSL